MTTAAVASAAAALLDPVPCKVTVTVDPIAAGTA